MDLLEYQAKELFREMGIPILPSQRIDHPKDLKSLQIPYPVVLKSQVRAGGRGKAGGVKFAENTIDAVAAAQTIFHLPILGEYPEVLLAEAKYNSQEEFYLAVVLDTGARRPVLLGSKTGGVEAEAVMSQMQLVVVDQELSSFYARRLAVLMGLDGPLIQAVSDIVEKMYLLFAQKDLALVEINPLGVSSTGEVMALDGKVTANDDALGRHCDLVELAGTTSQQKQCLGTSLLRELRLKQVEEAGNIGILSNGDGTIRMTLDWLYEAGVNPAVFVNVAFKAQGGLIPDVLCEQIQQGLDLLSQDKRVKVILVNIISSLTPGDRIVAAIKEYWQGRTNTDRSGSDLHVIVRVVGDQRSKASEIVTDMPITVVESLDDALDRVIMASKSSKED
ncbi:MAG: acetate--CoA ligase family protein [Hormoscilla sp. GM102CHS1]|nr:acetate--CoA ligase family protein [Hormoscilla sp. GM102CHS1]